MRSRNWKILGSLLLIVALVGLLESYSIWHELVGSNSSRTSSTEVSALPTGVTLDVEVLDANTSSPIPGASIYLNGYFQGATDSNGYVEVVTTYPPVDQSYNVTAGGYRYVSGTWRVDSNITGLNTTHIVVRLMPAILVHPSESQLLTVWQPLVPERVNQTVSYYLSLLRSNGTYPYPELASEIQQLPDATNSTAVAQIAILALNSTNPNVKLGFMTILRNGVPSPLQFRIYTVPSWNTELWNLYHLANDVSFGRNDPIPLAIAIDDGIFTVIGENSVRSQVRVDDAAMLRLSREIMVWQNEHGTTLLSQLPFEVLLYWAWRGSTTTVSGEDAGPLPLTNYINAQMPLTAYLWDTVSPQTLEYMRTDVDSLGWASSSVTVSDIVQNIETYFYFPGGSLGGGYHWEYHYDDGRTIDVYGVKVTSGAVLNVNWQYQERFRKGLNAYGYCVAETAFLEGWLKSVGIPTDAIRRHPVSGAYLGHIHVVYYDSIAQVWKGYYQQVRLGISNPTDLQWFQVLRLPFDYILESNNWTQLNLEQLQAMFVQNGVTSNQMQQWMS